MNKLINITCKRWFQKSYGNTYHTVYIEIIENNKTIKSLNTNTMEYGYGEQCYYTAVELLKPIFPRDMETAWQYFKYFLQDELGYFVNKQIIDVNRQKDL
jgi:hypothetical protein